MRSLWRDSPHETRVADGGHGSFVLPRGARRRSRQPPKGGGGVETRTATPGIIAGMRASVALLSILVAAACGQTPSAASRTETPAPSTSTAAPTPMATVAPSPLRTPVLTPPAEPSAPAVSPVPPVRVASPALVVTLLPAPFEASGQIRTDATEMFKSWVPQYLQALDRYRANSTPETKIAFENFVTAGPFLEVVRRSLGDLYSGTAQDPQRELVLSEATVDHVWAKPWGRPAYVDATIVYDDRTTTAAATKTERRTVRLRLVNQGFGFLRVLDGYDTVLGRWINGESPRYSAPALDAEAGDAIGYVLARESYVRGEQYPHSAIANGVPVQLSTPFAKSWEAAINALDEQYKRGDFAERRFDQVTASILTFEPATFIGDGVVTLRVDGKLVTVDKTGASSTTPVTRMLRFYRITRDGTNAGWAPIDEQSKTGAWISGGNLALAEIDQDRG